MLEKIPPMCTPRNWKTRWKYMYHCALGQNYCYYRLFNRIIYNVNNENGINKKPARAKSRTARFVKITVNYRISAVPEFILVTCMHIHNAIQTNYAHKGIRGGSWRDPGIRNDDYPRQATRRRQVFTAGSQREGKVSIRVCMEAAIYIPFRYSDARLSVHAFLPNPLPFPSYTTINLLEPRREIFSMLARLRFYATSVVIYR